MFYVRSTCFSKSRLPHQPRVYLHGVLTEYPLFSSNEYAQLEGKKTIQPADVIAALKENEFEHFIPRLEAELKSNINFSHVEDDL